jgi:uncharacterized repeat protein (TIGR01451 family)
LSVFNGANVQGQWSLYVVDDSADDEGNIAGGWSLNFNVADIIAPTADLMVRVTDSPDPLTIGSNVNYTVVVTNFGPATATGVVVSNQLPAGVTFLTAIPGQGSCSQTNGLVTCNIGTLSSGAGTMVVIAARTTLTGVLTDVAGVSGSQVDVNPANNSHSAKTTVREPAADLLVRVTPSADSLMVGMVASYTIAVTNFGPEIATGVVLSNQLPAGVTFLGATPSQGACTQADGLVTCNIGTLLIGGRASVVITGRTTLAGLITDIAGVSGSPADFNLADNVHSVSTTVAPRTVVFGRQGNNLVISWPASVTGVILESSATIQPATWLPVNQTPVQSGGMNVITIIPTEAHRFYRLRTP